VLRSVTIKCGSLDYTRPDAALAAYSSARGTGLLASALGALAAPLECEAVVQNLLSRSPLPQRSRHLLIGARAGPVATTASSASAEFAKVAASAAGAPPSGDMAQRWECRALDALAAVQRDAAREFRKRPNPFGLQVIAADPGPGGMADQWAFGYVQDAAALGVSMTKAVKAEMRERAGGYGRLLCLGGRQGACDQQQAAPVPDPGRGPVPRGTA
jgi:hypothetical protein